MLENLLNSIPDISSVRVVECEIRESEPHHGTHIEVSKKKDELTWKECRTWNSADELLSILGKTKIPLLILVHGDSILSKRIPRKFDNARDLIETIVPSAGPDQFYMDSHHNLGHSHVSLVRKEALDQWLKRFENYFVLDVFIGAQSITLLPEFIPGIQEDIITRGYRLQQDSSGLWSFSFEENNSEACEVQLGEETLSSEYLMALSAGVQFLFHLYPKLSLLPHKITSQRSDAKYKVILDGIIKPVLAILILVLLANFLFLNKLKSEYEGLILHLELNKQQTVTVEKLKSDLRLKQELWTKSGWDSGLIIPKLCDEIAARVPTEISLTSMHIQPMIKESVYEDRLEFEQKTVVLDGLASNSQIVHSWMQKLKEIKGVHQVDLTRYSSHDHSSSATFKLKLSLQ